MQVSAHKNSSAVPLLRSPRFLGKHKALPLLVLLLLIAWALRLYHLGTMSLWWDESLSWDRATNSLPTILSNTIQIQNIATRDLHPPFYFLLLSVMAQIAGTTEFALRFFSAMANLATLALFVPLTRVLFGKRATVIALLTILFATVSPFYVWYAQEARPYALALLLSVFTVYALLRWLKTQPQTWRGFFSRWFLFFGIGFAASFLTLYLSFVLLPFFAVTILIFGDTWNSLRARRVTPLMWFAALLVAMFGVVLFLMPRETDITSWEQVGPLSVPFFVMLRDVWNSFSVGLSLVITEAGWFDLFLLAVWLIGIFSLVRVRERNARLALFLFCYLFVPALALQLGSFIRPLYLNSRHLITTSPAFYLGLALGVDAIARKLAASQLPPVVRRPSSIIAALLLIGVVVGGALYSLNNFYFDETYAKDDHKSWAGFLNERWRAGDYLILVAPQAEKIVEYYAPPQVQWQSLPNLGQTRDAQEFLDRDAVSNIYRTHPRVWLLELHQPVADPTLHIRDLLTRWGSATDEYIFRGISTEIRLTQFVPNKLPLKPDALFNAADKILFRNKLALAGFDAPKTIEAGERATLNLYWQKKRKLTPQVNVSVRVMGENGEVWGQSDAPPVGSLQPLAQWKRNRVYLDQANLIVDAGAPPGTYFVELDVYPTNGDAAWRATRGGAEIETPVRLGEIEVVRPSAPRDPNTIPMTAYADVAFGDSVRLRGFDSEGTTANPGSEFPLTLYFQVAQPTAQNLRGVVELEAPWWQFWNRARAAAPFELDAQNRQAGDIVQARVKLRVPGDANAGEYVLRVLPEGAAAKTFSPLDTFSLGNITVNLLTRSTDLPPISHPLYARFDDKIELLGYDLDAPSPLKPNDRVRLKLFWRALKPMDTSYTVFTHLIDNTNKIFGQQDKEPLDGARPTTSWAVGEIFQDTYEFDVASDAPPGNYQLEIGFYTKPDFARLPTFDAQGNAAGDRVVFENLRVQ